jgi:hypothetical protein
MSLPPSQPSVLRKTRPTHRARLVVPLDQLARRVIVGSLFDLVDLFTLFGEQESQVGFYRLALFSPGNTPSATR